MSDTQLYTVIYRRGRTWTAGIPFFEQIGVEEHRHFLIEQFRAQRLKYGGPFLDDTGGVAIFRSESCEGLEELINSDPTVAGGLLSYEVHPVALPFIAAAP